MNDILILNEPFFSFVRRDYTGLNWWQRARKVCSEPPQLSLERDFVVLLSEKYLAKLAESYRIDAELLGQPLYLVAMAGMITDLASIPRMFWSVPGFSPDGVLRYGALLHDPGYQYGYLLTPKRDDARYPESSWLLHQMCPGNFGSYMPVLVGAPQELFDQLLHDITVAATGAKWIAGKALWALNNWGDRAWNNYRNKGPAAYGTNSLGLPGLADGGGIRFTNEEIPLWKGTKWVAAA